MDVLRMEAGMPGYTFVVQRRVLDKAFEDDNWHFRWRMLKNDVREAVAEGMSSLKWGSDEVFIVDPQNHLTPVYLLAGSIADGDQVELGDDIAAVLSIKAFAYPSRMQAVPLMDVPRELWDLVKEKRLNRPMDERLEEIRQRVKAELETNLKVEVEFQPQQIGEWVGG